MARIASYLALGALWVGLMLMAGVYMDDTANPEEAALHCRADIVVWVNTSPYAGVYHLRGEIWYGRTGEGRFMCRADAETLGYRPMPSMEP